MSLEGDQPSGAADAAPSAAETASSPAAKGTASGAASRGRSPGAKSKQMALEDWSAANVEKWFKTYKDGKYAEEYAGFAGLDGRGLSRLSEAEFLERSKKGDLLFRVVKKATGEDTTGKPPVAGRHKLAVAPVRSRSKSPNAPIKHNATAHLNKEEDNITIQAKKASLKSADKPTDKKEEKETTKVAKPPKLATEETEAPSETSKAHAGADPSTPKAAGGETGTPKTTGGETGTPKAHAAEGTPKAHTAAHIETVHKEKCEVEGCDAMAVQGVYCAHHRVKPPDEDGNSSFSGSFVLGENSAESDKKLHDKLEAIYERFAARETHTMDKGRWVTACESLNLVDNKAVRRLDVELVFNVIKPVKGKPVLQFEHFCRGLSQIALKKYPDKGGRSLRYMVRTDLARA